MIFQALFHSITIHQQEDPSLVLAPTFVQIFARYKLELEELREYSYFCS